MTKGEIIFLNGTSSSGKTTIAKRLQELLTEPYMHLSIDAFFYFYPEYCWNPKTEEEVARFRKTVSVVIPGFHRSVAALAEAGNNIIVDHVMENSHWLDECLESWQNTTVFFVGIKCPLPVLEKREQERGDRAKGLAKMQYDRVHAHGLYDLEIDTSLLEPDQCVKSIIQSLKKKPQQTAFEILLQRKNDRIDAEAEQTD